MKMHNHCSICNVAEHRYSFIKVFSACLSTLPPSEEIYTVYKCCGYVQSHYSYILMHTLFAELLLYLASIHYKYCCVSKNQFAPRKGQIISCLSDIIMFFIQPIKMNCLWYDVFGAAKWYKGRGFAHAIDGQKTL